LLVSCTFFQGISDLRSVTIRIICEDWITFIDSIEFLFAGATVGGGIVLGGVWNVGGAKTLTGSTVVVARWILGIGGWFGAFSIVAVFLKKCEDKQGNKNSLEWGCLFR
jgi:hypothetical protein